MQRGPVPWRSPPAKSRQNSEGSVSASWTDCFSGASSTEDEDVVVIASARFAAPVRVINRLSYADTLHHADLSVFLRILKRPIRQENPVRVPSLLDGLTLVSEWRI